MQLLSNLPAHLLERARLHPNSPTSEPVRDRVMVLYWMQTAMRLDENPALDVAAWFARRLGLPLLIYQGVSARYEYASDRHHTFILEGARDLQQAAAERGLDYALVVERDQTRAPLAELLKQAAVTIVEDMPTDPHRMFVRAAIRRSDCPFVAVDTACVVPMQLLGRCYTRAFEYRDKTRRLYKERLKRSWPAEQTGEQTHLRLSRSELSISDLIASDLSSSDVRISEIVAQCDIDHTISPVPETRGGMVAAQQRWEEFKTHKLRRYADRRNDPLQDPSSRLSAYLHYGMISPLRVAREAAEIGGAGAEKFLDELLIWRELAYAFCFYRSDHHLWNAIPQWAQETLRDHQRDEREHVYCWETLARAATHDHLWNAAQRSLLFNGELHNNVRMTWGKALLEWCQAPRHALRMIIDLNHRYALDGRDPASYGGILWCLGQFDRPFSPEQPVLGTVRGRSTQEHARRLDVASYERQIRKVSPRTRKRIAVVGAGLSGLFAARTLRDLGYEVTVFEKSSGPAGRMSTRRASHADFDHGAQYFTCRDRRFRRYVDSWTELGLVAKWETPIAVYAEGKQLNCSRAERYVALPSMNALGKHLAADLDVKYGTKIESLKMHASAWSLCDEAGQVYDDYQQLIMALPAPQTAELVAGVCPQLGQDLQSHRYAPCWAVMLNLTEPLPVAWGGAFLNTGPVRWLARNQTKPGRRADIESLVLHAQGTWSTEHFDLQPTEVIEQLTTALRCELGIDFAHPTYAVAHRWRYAMPIGDMAITRRALTNEDGSIIACGDWASGSRVEGAFLSGAAAVGLIAAT